MLVKPDSVLYVRKRVHKYNLDERFSGIQLYPVDILILLFADDIALIADTVGGLQRQLCLQNSF